MEKTTKEREATIVLSNKRWIYGIWAMGDSISMDWMGCLYREIDTMTEWHFNHRFRYYKDDKVFGSKDRKSCYSGVIPIFSPEEYARMIEGTKTAIQILKSSLPEVRVEEFHLCECLGDDPKIMKMLESSKMFHIKKMPIKASGKN